MNQSVILEGRTIEVNGWPLHYVASTVPVDPNPPVVLVHGVGLSHRYLLPVAVRLAQDFQVYSPDLPGFGLSYKPPRVLTISELGDWLAAWVDAMQLGPVAMLGNSVGCQYIVDTASRYPDRVSRAILQGPTCDRRARTFPRQFWRWNRNRMREYLMSKGSIPVREISPDGSEQIIHTRVATPRDYLECGIWRLIKTFQYALEDKLEEKLPAMECPTLVVRGAIDPIVSQQWAEEITELLPQGRLIVIPGCPHTANLEAPLELSRIARPFFQDERELAASERREFEKEMLGDSVPG